MPLSAHTTFLSHSRILRKYLDGYWPYADPNLSKLSQEVFTALREGSPGQPDYIHSMRIRVARRNVPRSFSTYLDHDAPEGGIPERFSLRDRLAHAVRSIEEEFLIERGGMLYVRQSVFEPWQECLTRLSPLPLLAAAAYRRYEGDLAKAQKLVLRTLQHSSLPGCREPELDDMIRAGEVLGEGSFGPGLDDLHIHLNGTTEACQAWLHCLREPYATLCNLQEQWSKPTVRQFYSERGIASNDWLFRLFLLADWLRCWMLELCFPSLTLPGNGEELQPYNQALTLEELRDGLSLTSSRRHPHFTWRGKRFGHPMDTRRLKYPLPRKHKITPLQMEGVFLLYAIDELFCGNCRRFPVMLHCYLLLQNYFVQLTVQQKEQVGFDQFQHITDNALRDAVEKEYKERFNQLHGMYGPDLSYVEGRFSPPDDPAKCIALVERIVQGYWLQFPSLRPDNDSRYDSKKAKTEGQNEKHIRDFPASFTLRLVAHFIKKPDSVAEENYCRHYALRRDLERRCGALLEAYRRSPRVRNFLVGVDAAANEMHAPPEVFAPIFRRCRKVVNNFTYHVGEDYLHLVSGIRAIAEAILYLDLKSGDRLGHCTALGIDPDIWLRAMGKKCYCPRGEWLDNLVWMAHVLEGNSDFSSELAAFKEEINQLYAEIYQKPEISRRILFSAWKLRDIDPLKSVWMESEWTSWNMIPFFTHFETAYAVGRIKNQLEAYEQFRLYHNPKYRKKFNEIIAVDTKKTPPELLRFLQDHLVGHLNEKHLIVEVMPTSNLFISFYQNYKEHHIFRWMEKKPDRPVPQFCLGSDDPGIFATNMRNEITHLLHIARELYPGSNSPMGAMRSLVRRGRAARFSRNAGYEENIEDQDSDWSIS